MTLKKLGGNQKKPSINAMIDEIDRAIENYPRLESKGLGRKAELEHRVGILRWVRRKLQWWQEHEADVTLFLEIKRLNPDAMQKLLNFVRAEQELRAAEEAAKDAA